MSMEIGGEISQKIRSAIKAKLVDLGAYVDDELPDYIMVMVANKKTKDQMTDDLNLFLGHNTEKFTSWLSALLEKLHSISAGVSESAAAPSPGNKPESKPTATDASKTASIPGPYLPTEQPLQKDPASTSTDKKSDKPADDSLRKRTVSEGKSSSAHTSAKKSRVIDTDNIKPLEKDVSNKALELEINPIKDELEDLEDTLKSTQPKLVRTERPQRPSEAAKPARTSSPPHSGRRHAPTRSLAKPAPRKAAADKISMSSRLGLTSEKRKGPASAVGAVVRHSVEEEEEEEYDPYKPAIGNVASVVKISERKSKVPAAWQADKSILLKAVNAAQDSIEKSTRRTERAIVHPTVKEPSSRSNRDQRRELQHRLGDRSGRSHASESSRSGLHSDRSGLHSDRMSHRKSPTRIHESQGRIRRSRSPQRSHDREKESGNLHRSVEVLKVIKKEPDTVFERLQSVSSDGEKSDTINSDQKIVVSDDYLDLSLPEDSRLIEYDPEEMSKPRHLVPAYRSTPVMSSSMTLILDGADESDFTDGEENESHSFREKERRLRKDLRPVRPKFVVTLDGVDPDMMSMEKRDTEFTDPKLGRNIVRVEPFPQCPKIQPISVNLAEDQDYDMEDDENVIESDLGNKPEKCRFFPNCRNGETCPFVHPSEPCMLVYPNEPYMSVPKKCYFFPECWNGEYCHYGHPTEPCIKFPRCKFGDKCLYIHPQCKFDVTCTRSDCPFSHSQKGAAQQFQSSVPFIVQPVNVPMFMPGGAPPRPVRKHPAEVVCKFFPKCTNMNCAFLHPKPCRFGISCNNKSTCSFLHPDLPQKKQFKWSSKTHKSASDVPVEEKLSESAVK